MASSVCFLMMAGFETIYRYHAKNNLDKIVYIVTEDRGSQLYLEWCWDTLAAIHLLFLHETGSNNPTGIPSDTDKIPFHPYYTKTF